MAVTRGTLQIARRLRRDIGTEVDQVVRDLTIAWIKAWDELATLWQLAAADLVAEAGRLEHWPRPTDIARLDRVMGALDASEEALARLAEQTRNGAADGANRVIDADVDFEARIIASQAPATEQEGLLRHLSGRMPVAEQDRDTVQLQVNTRIRTDAVNVMRRRASGQITADTLPLAADATAAMRRELIRGVDLGANPREAAARMVAGAEGQFNGGLTRALNISRTEILDAYRTTSQQIHAANSDIVPAWSWLSTFDRRACPSCLSMHGTQFPASEPGPDDHPSGRCARLPVLASWAELGITAPEPPSAMRSSQAWFNNLPEATQLQIMGPARLQLYRGGRVGWGDLSSTRQNPGWRPSRVPTPVRDLQRRADSGLPPTPGPTTLTRPTITTPSLPIPRPRNGAGIGRDIVDDLDLEELAPKTGVRGSTSGAAGDRALGDIATRQGFDAAPTVGTAADVDTVIARGGVELYRGVTEARFVEEFRSGDYFPGLGLYGNGTYTSTVRSTAVEYADGNADNVARMALTPEARTTTLSELERMMADDGISVGPTWMPNDRDRVLGDPGRYAASKGYDAYTIDPGSSAGLNLGDEQWWVVLNRSAVVVQR